MSDKTRQKRKGAGGGKEPKRARRNFDYSRFRRRKIAVQLAYVGFLIPEGFVQQAPDDNTVEDHLFKSAAKCCLTESRELGEYSRCGRTDKGVSAIGNVIAFMVRSKAKPGEELPAVSDEMDYGLLLNRVLPEGIRCVRWAPVADDFDARFDCSFRAYRYFFVQNSLNLAAMREACALLVGENDYRNFCTHDVSNVTHFNRRILEAEIVETAMQGSADPRFKMCYMYVKGTAFLYHQVRCTFALLRMVGLGLEKPSLISRLLDVKKQVQKPQYNPAGDAPLVLYETGYPEAKLQWIENSADCQLKLAQHNYELWQRYMLHSATLFGLTDSFGGQPLPVGKHIPMLERHCEDPVELKFATFHKKQERKKQEAAAENGEAANGEAANGENA
jgi:tRNA pseudouridine38/39 synthase